MHRAQVEYLLQHHGYSYLGENGKTLAMFEDSKGVFRSVECQVPDAGKRVCQTCAKHANNVSSAKWRLEKANVDNWRFIPVNKMTGLLTKESFIKKLRSQVSYLNDKVKAMEMRAAEFINPEVILEEKESKEIVAMLVEVLEEGHLKPENFTFCLLKQQLACLLQDDARAFRWDERIIHWALSLQYHGGRATIEHLRGKATKGEGSHGHLKNNRANWALFLPGDSTLRSYLPLIRPYARVDKEKVMEVAEACANLDDKRGGIVWDEIKILFTTRSHRNSLASQTAPFQSRTSTISTPNICTIIWQLMFSRFFFILFPKKKKKKGEKEKTT